MRASDTVTLYRPVGQRELDLIQSNGWRAFPLRLLFQPYVYPVCSRAFAEQIARDWKTRDVAWGYVGHVTRFQVDAAFLALYPGGPSEGGTTGNAGYPPGTWRRSIRTWRVPLR